MRSSPASRSRTNSVASSDITNNLVGSVDVKTESLTSTDIMNGTLHTVDFAAGQLRAGAPGPAGAGGAAGAPGISGLQIVEASSANNSASMKQIDVTCPAGKQVIGGGAHGWNARSDVALDESFPHQRDDMACHRLRGERNRRQLVPRRSRNLRDRRSLSSVDLTHR